MFSNRHLVKIGFPSGCRKWNPSISLTDIKIWRWYMDQFEAEYMCFKVVLVSQSDIKIRPRCRWMPVSRRIPVWMQNMEIHQYLCLGSRSDCDMWIKLKPIGCGSMWCLFRNQLLRDGRDIIGFPLGHCCGKEIHQYLWLRLRSDDDTWINLKLNTRALKWF